MSDERNERTYPTCPKCGAPLPTATAAQQHACEPFLLSRAEQAEAELAECRKDAYLKQTALDDSQRQLAEAQAELERLRLDSVEAGLLRAALGGLALRFGIEPEIERILAEIKVDAARLLEKPDA